MPAFSQRPVFEQLEGSPVRNFSTLTGHDSTQLLAPARTASCGSHQEHDPSGIGQRNEPGIVIARSGLVCGVVMEIDTKSRQGRRPGDDPDPCKYGAARGRKTRKAGKSEPAKTGHYGIPFENADKELPEQEDEADKGDPYADHHVDTRR